MRFLGSLILLSILMSPTAGESQVLPGKARQGGPGLNGGGSTFVNPAMSRWANEFNKATGIQVNYQSIGSGGGIRNFSNKTLDFGASDGPMTEEQLKQAGGGVLHIPVTMGAVAISYNVPNLTSQLTLSGPVLADIYLGKITRWNHPSLKALNEGITLPDEEIAVVRRADGSGTTYIFSDFLSKVSPEFKERIGTGTTMDVKVGLAAKGNEGVSVQIKRAAYSIGYVELLYALEAKVETAKVVNAAGNAVAASPESVTVAAASVTEYPEDLRVSITNAQGAQAYPISGFVWVFGWESGMAPEKVESFKKFLTYVLSDQGQAVAASLKYSKLPENLLKLSMAKVARIK
jgi:phosphate transport system substrate-binding protein